MRFAYACLCFALFGTSIGYAQTSTIPEIQRDRKPVEDPVKSAFGYLTIDTKVTLLNEGGKRVVADKLKRIPQGGTCTLKINSTIARIAGGSPGQVHARYLGIQRKSGGCPFRTEFEMSEASYAAAQAAFKLRWDQKSTKQ